MNHSPSSTAYQNDPEPGSEQTALAPRRPQLPALQPEVIIEIPAPVKRLRRSVWLGAGVVAPLIITLIALSALAVRSQRAATASLSATVAAVDTVVAQLTAQRSVARQTDTVSGEATTQAGVAPRLVEGGATQSPQPTTSAAAAPTISPANDRVGTEVVADESAPVFGKTKAVLHLRLGPGEEYESLGLMPAGEQLRLLGRTVDSGWFFVSKADGFGAEGWVAGWLVDIPGDPSRLAVVSHLSLSAQSER